MHLKWQELVRNWNYISVVWSETKLGDSTVGCCSTFADALLVMLLIHGERAALPCPIISGCSHRGFARHEQVPILAAAAPGS